MRRAAHVYVPCSYARVSTMLMACPCPFQRQRQYANASQLPTNANQLPTNANQLPTNAKCHGCPNLRPFCPLSVSFSSPVPLLSSPTHHTYALCAAWCLLPVSGAKLKFAHHSQEFLITTDGQAQCISLMQIQIKILHDKLAEQAAQGRYVGARPAHPHPQPQSARPKNQRPALRIS